MAAEKFYDDDADLSVIQSKKVAVIGLKKVQKKLLIIVMIK